MAFPCLTIFITICLVLFFRYKYVNEKRETQEQDFFDKELKSRATVGRIEESDYEVIPLSKFPFGLCEDPLMLEMEEKIQQLSSEKLLNLTGVSNTDVKLRFGVNHFDEAVAAGEKYDELIGLLVKYAIELSDHGFTSESGSFLEQLISMGCDIKSAWIALGKYYKSTSQFEKIQALIDQVDSSNLSIKKATKEQLSEMVPQDSLSEE